jgi:hypothetical protein
VVEYPAKKAESTMPSNVCGIAPTRSQISDHKVGIIIIIILVVTENEHAYAGQTE